MLLTHHEVLDMELRDKIVGSLALLRKKDVIDATQLLEIYLPILISTPSKSLRQLILSKVLSELRTANSKTTNHRLNSTYMYNMHVRHTLTSCLLPTQKLCSRLSSISWSRTRHRRRAYGQVRCYRILSRFRLLCSPFRSS
jgi:hypothetical protein